MIFQNTNEKILEFLIFVQFSQQFELIRGMFRDYIMLMSTSLMFASKVFVYIYIYKTISVINLKLLVLLCQSNKDCILKMNSMKYEGRI